MTADPIFQTLAAARARLVAAGVSPREAAVDVELFARTVLRWDRARLLTEQGSPTPAALEPTFSEWLSRRARREPSAYIIGSREFWGLEFHVSPSVLIPRPETEFIVEEALALIEDRDVRIADIGTGCGNLAVSLAHEVDQCHVTATDVSAGALLVARENAIRHNVHERITFVETSYLDGLDGPFDVIVSNPPYVKSGDKPALSAEVQHEPDVALFGGGSGFDHIDAVVDAAIRALVPGGWLLMEFGFAQDDDVAALVESRPALRLDRIRQDLQGIPRTAIIQRIAAAP
jgi:release factor glutamine methyltransferase